MPKSIHYFTEFTFWKGVFYGTMLLYIILTCIVATLEPFMEHECDEDFTVEFPNPHYNENPCRHHRMAKLLFLTPDECSFGRRLVASVLLGGIIGWERQAADRPAGIRTMSLVSLGSCLFTIDSAFAFLDGPMTWDASRISAAIPSGVGFLGAGLIFKEQGNDKLTGEQTHTVHGLTTATSVWISAAVGVACGGELYFAASFGIALALTLLRFGPRIRSDDDDDDEFSTAPLDEKSERVEVDYGSRDKNGGGPPILRSTLDHGQSRELEEQRQLLIKRNSSHHDLTKSQRESAAKKRKNRPHLGGVV